MKVNLNPLNNFLETWSISALSKELGGSFEEALDYLELPEVRQTIDDRAKRITRVYSRMPKAFYAQVIMSRVAQFDGQTRATEIATVMQCFLQWFREAPPPSDREFAEQLLNLMGDHKEN